MNKEKMTYLEAIIFEACRNCDRQQRDMPDAAPLDLLTRQQRAEMEEFLEENFGILREFIDEHYVALLIALSVYEPVDLRAKIADHLVHNIKAS